MHPRPSSGWSRRELALYSVFVGAVFVLVLMLSAALEFDQVATAAFIVFAALAAVTCWFVLTVRRLARADPPVDERPRS